MKQSKVEQIKESATNAYKPDGFQGSRDLYGEGHWIGASEQFKKDFNPVGRVDSMCNAYKSGIEYGMKLYQDAIKKFAKVNGSNASNLLFNIENEIKV